ncbi:unnamed protein product [Penicillium glandicola]
MLEFLTDGGDWHGLLEDMRRMIRENTMWGDRDVTTKPKVRIGLQLLINEIGRGQWIEEEVHNFIYGEGGNPFSDRWHCDTSYGVGILEDAFEPDFERPNVNRDDLIEMGIYKEHYVTEVFRYDNCKFSGSIMLVIISRNSAPATLKAVISPSYLLASLECLGTVTSVLTLRSPVGVPPA